MRAMYDIRRHWILSNWKFNQMCVKSFFNCLSKTIAATTRISCPRLRLLTRDTRGPMERETVTWWCSVLIQTDGLSVCVLLCGPSFIVVIIIIVLGYPTEISSLYIYAVKATKYYSTHPPLSLSLCVASSIYTLIQAHSHTRINTCVILL